VKISRIYTSRTISLPINQSSYWFWTKHCCYKKKCWINKKKENIVISMDICFEKAKLIKIDELIVV